MACRGASPATSHLCLDATSQATCVKVLEGKHSCDEHGYVGSCVTRSNPITSSSDSSAYLLRSLEVLEFEVLKLRGLVRQANRDNAELRTCDWMQCLKPLSIMRTRQPPLKAVMTMPRCITCGLTLVSGRNVTSHCRQNPQGV